MKKLLLLLSLCTLAGYGCGQALPAPAKTPAVDATVTPAKAEAPAKAPAGVLDGVWLPEKCEYQGKDELEPKLKDALRLSIEKGEHKLYFLTDPSKMIGQRLSTAVLTVDEKKGTFELAMNDGQRKGEKVHGIFEITGDTLKLCYGPSTEDRPTTFAAKAEQKGVFNEVWTRFHSKK